MALRFAANIQSTLFSKRSFRNVAMSGENLNGAGLKSFLSDWSSLIIFIIASGSKFRFRSTISAMTVASLAFSSYYNSRRSSQIGTSSWASKTLVIAAFRSLTSELSLACSFEDSDKNSRSVCLPIFIAVSHCVSRPRIAWGASLASLAYSYLTDC